MKNNPILQFIVFTFIILCFTSCCEGKIKKLEEKHSTELQTNTETINFLRESLYKEGKYLFNGEYATGYVVLQPKFGRYGMLEMHHGNSHLQSYLALYDMVDLEDLSLGSKYYVKVKNFGGLPKVVEAKKSLNESDKLYSRTPYTYLDYHILSNHGEKAGWHKYGHRINKSYSFDGNVSKLKIKPDDNSAREYIVPENLREIAQIISEDSTIDTIYYELNSEETEFIGLDTVHRHGKLFYKF